MSEHPGVPEKCPVALGASPRRLPPSAVAAGTSLTLPAPPSPCRPEQGGGADEVDSRGGAAGADRRAGGGGPALRLFGLPPLRGTARVGSGEELRPQGSTPALSPQPRCLSLCRASRLPSNPTPLRRRTRGWAGRPSSAGSARPPAPRCTCTCGKSRAAAPCLINSCCYARMKVKEVREEAESHAAWKGRSVYQSV